MLDFFRGTRPWTQLDRILIRLPRHSTYRAALDNDEDFAERAAILGVTSGPPGPPPLVGYDAVAARLDNIFDAVNAVNETLLTVYSKKNTRIQPNRAPRPQTAYQRLQEKATHERLDDLEAKALGRR